MPDFSGVAGLGLVFVASLGATVEVGLREENGHDSSLRAAGRRLIAAAVAGRVGVVGRGKRGRSISHTWLLEVNSDSIKHRTTCVRLNIGQNGKNENKNTLVHGWTLVSLMRTHSSHNKDIVVEEFVNHVGNNQNFDYRTVPAQK
ncbi:hypothetical protein Tco_0689510 [Tanacetum coccineum]